MSYRIAAPDEYLAITGMNVQSVKITKATWLWPFQRCMRFSVQPHDYAMNLQAMTKEKLIFLLPVVFTVGPDVNERGANSSVESHGADGDETIEREDRGDALTKYAMLLADADENKKAKRNTAADNTHVGNIVKGIIEGEVRVLVSSMTMEEIFTEREVFKRRIFKNIQSELSQFGLKIYNANVKELRDAPESNYFESLSRKAHEGASNQARIDVAEARLRGNVGEARRVGEQEREIAMINAETAVQKTERDTERATAEAKFSTAEASLHRDVEIARVEAKRALEVRDEDLKRAVEIKRAAAEVERLRARDVVKATIARESKQQDADARAYEIEADAKANFEKSQRETDALAYKTQMDADAAIAADFNRTTKAADADAYAARTRAEAHLIATQKEAAGMLAMAEAYGKMADAFGGPAGLLQYMMIEKGTYRELADANARAIHGLQPKISVWNTGSQGAGGGGGDASGTETMKNLYQMLPPLMTTINEQTGITLPEWQFGKMAAGTEAVKGEVKVNGKH
ncbi:Flotillin-like protein 1 like [Verticillium longisporum]|uniref:Flotillin-like protein 1 like n=2 Tax=Verticillium TaxID=1036719 RepID=A0A8I3AV07_VERLO|nr:Flotillin-like protein 1 like [Verticillium longisporum]PNH40838.1 hypothetical protein VD0004_g6202 [Verticillium dahliae]PNH71520.1 hypothetical protein VD0001_g6036 [Verticillium dahliae]RBQ82677.1 hypothetical protein VDGD_07585 [Verticillium dahliae]RXG42014.1 hypothetical protein VDGE_07585 [Verticillium dahliae]